MSNTFRKKELTKVFREILFALTLVVNTACIPDELAHKLIPNLKHDEWEHIFWSGHNITLFYSWFYLLNKLCMNIVLVPTF